MDHTPGGYVIVHTHTHTLKFYVFFFYTEKRKLSITLRASDRQGRAGAGRAQWRQFFS